MLSRREAIAALASTAALPLCPRAGATGHRPRSRPEQTRRGAHAARRRCRQSASPVAGERDLAGHRHRREGGSSIASSPIDPPRDSSGSRRSFAPTWSASTPSTRAASRTRCAPASRLCEVPIRRRSKVSRSPTATSRLAAGATPRTSSFRTSVPISTSRASWIAIIESRTPPTPRRIWRGCSRMRSSSMASLGASRRRAQRGSCRRRS